MKSFGIGFVCFILGIFFAAAVGENKKKEAAGDFINTYKGYLDVLDRVSAAAKDPQSSKVIAIFTASEVLKARATDGTPQFTPEAAAKYYEELMASTDDVVVQRAIRMQLAQLYKDAGQPDKSLETLRTIIAEPAPPKVE